MLAFITNFFATLAIIFKRLWHNLGLSITSLAGIVAVLALVISVPVFSYAISGEVLNKELADKATKVNRRLFSLHMYYLNSTAQMVVGVEQADSIATFLKNRIPELTGLQVERIISEIQTGTMRLVALDDKGYENSSEALFNITLFQVDDFASRVEVIDGKWPDPTAPGAIQVLIPEEMADTAFMNVGDHFKMDNLEIEIVGIWRVKNPLDPNWFNEPVGAYKDKIWIPEETFRDRLAKEIRKPVFYASWYIIIDDQRLHYQRAPQYARGLMRLDSEMTASLPGIKTDYTPLEVLQEYQKRAQALSTLLYAVGAPMIVLALLFIGLTSRIAVQQYEQETATIRGRGTSRAQVMAMNLIETFILLITGAPLALGGGWLAASAMGNTLSFLRFTERPPLNLSFDGLSWPLIGVMVFLIIAARFMPVVEMSRVTIVRMKQEQSRGGGKPLWERFYLDFVVLAIAIYAFLVMRGWAKPASFLAQMQLSGESYRDPLLFVAPALFAIAVCMVALRLVPLIVRLLAAIVEKLPGVWAYLSLQQIARRPQDHSNALLLIMISLSLAIFSASTAKTLDQWLYDSELYRAGTDLAVEEYMVEGGITGGYGSTGETSGGGATTLTAVNVFNSGYTAVDAHSKLPSVRGAARVGRYGGTFSFGTGEVKCTFMGIDRYEFQQVAFFRDDFASVSFGDLMNALGSSLESVLLPEKTAAEMGLRVGDQIDATIYVADGSYERELIVMGTYNYFPTIYPNDQTTLIMNLEGIFDDPEAISDYGVWLDLEPDADVRVVEFQIQQMIGGENVVVKETGNAIEAIHKGQEQPERQGLFGVLTIGFLTTGLMPGIGFVLYSYASLRRRFIQLGILQAIGLSVKQLIGYLALEQFLLMGLSIVAGAGIGLLTSVLYVPFLQVGAAPGAPVPPFWVLIGWTEAAWLSIAFGIVLFLTMVGTITYLVRLKVFQAVKLGETL